MGLVVKVMTSGKLMVEDILESLHSSPEPVLSGDGDSSGSSRGVCKGLNIAPLCLVCEAIVVDLVVAGVSAILLTVIIGDFVVVFLMGLLLLEPRL